MEKLDLRKEWKELYAPSARHVDVVTVPRFQFAMIDGQIEDGQPPEQSESFQEALNVLYGVTYTLKFMSKLREAEPINYRIMALEGLWWTESGKFDFDRKQDWHFTLMIVQPDHIDRKMYQEAISSLREKKGEIPALGQLRFEAFEEGLCMQILHVGAYDLEPMTIARLKDFSADNGYRINGKHHEIYLSDPRRAKPDKIRTILRYPIEKV
jgi:hypothetical protein